MTTQRTLSIVKPDAVRKGHMGAIMARFEQEGLKIVAAKMLHLTTEQAAGFYAVHSQRPFFKDLIGFISSAPVMVMVLEGDNAIERNRALMGATDPKKAEEGTLRAMYADSIDENAVHGSDAPETAAQEIMYFFNALELPGQAQA